MNLLVYGFWNDSDRGERERERKREKEGEKGVEIKTTRSEMGGVGLAPCHGISCCLISLIVSVVK